MQSFTVITDTPQRMATFFVNRGIVEQYTDPATGQTAFRGVLPGLEFVRVPNPIITAPGPPPTYDNRAVYLVKFAHESENQKALGFRNWILANSSTITAPPNYTFINGEPAGDARKIDGENVWIVHDRPERFGVWQ